MPPPPKTNKSWRNELDRKREGSKEGGRERERERERDIKRE
jgi:hypothetical protein